MRLRSRSQGLFHFARRPSVYFRALFASGIVPMQRLCNHKIHRHTHTGLYALLILCNTCSAITTFRLVKVWLIIMNYKPWHRHNSAIQHQSSSLHKTLPSKAGFILKTNCFTLKVFIALQSVSCRFVASLLYQILCPLFNELMHSLAKCKKLNSLWFSAFGSVVLETWYIWKINCSI